MKKFLLIIIFLLTAYLIYLACFAGRVEIYLKTDLHTGLTLKERRAIDGTPIPTRELKSMAPDEEGAYYVFGEMRFLIGEVYEVSDHREHLSSATVNLNVDGAWAATIFPERRLAGTWETSWRVLPLRSARYEKAVYLPTNRHVIDFLREAYQTRSVTLPGFLLMPSQEFPEYLLKYYVKYSHLAPGGTRYLIESDTVLGYIDFCEHTDMWSGTFGAREGLYAVNVTAQDEMIILDIAARLSAD